jgi:hypothetical protein
VLRHLALDWQFGPAAALGSRGRPSLCRTPAESCNPAKGRRVLGRTDLEGCPACGAGWKAIDVSHGPACPRNLLDEAMDTPNGVLVRRCFRIMGAKSMGLTITLSDITEEE